MTPEHANYREMRAEFLEIYESNILRDSRLFPGTGRIAGRNRRRAAWPGES
jgi:hypothetical protein